MKSKYSRAEIWMEPNTEELYLITFYNRVITITDSRGNVRATQMSDEIGTILTVSILESSCEYIGEL